MDHTVTRPLPDYEADDVVVVYEPERLRALADELRAKIVLLLRERARSTKELADELGLPKGTVGHHLKVLESADLIRVVRTRQVRAVTEKFYGRTARLFVMKGEEDPALGATLKQVALRHAAEEIGRAAEPTVASTQSFLHVRLGAADARRFERRLERLVDDFRAAESPDGQTYGLVTALYPLDDE
jgi:DNA-binding transcriptional ArsR family regulator